MRGRPFCKDYTLTAFIDYAVSYLIDIISHRMLIYNIELSEGMC